MLNLIGSLIGFPGRQPILSIRFTPSHLLLISDLIIYDIVTMKQFNIANDIMIERKVNIQTSIYYSGYLPFFLS